MFQVFTRNLLLLEQEDIADLLFFSFVYTPASQVFKYSHETIVIARLLYDVSDKFFIAPCLANLSDISFE